MTEFVECTNCGFVLQASSERSPEPEHWDSCPDCGRTEFGFAGR